MFTFLSVDQVRSILERLLMALGVWLVAKGYIGESEVAQFAPLLIGGLSALYGWYKTRPVSLIQRAAAVPGTSVLTTPEIAAATPERNIVSTTAQLNQQEFARHEG